jgi:antitoxin component HigA of HigAB toxin-antitoxin module
MNEELDGAAILEGVMEIFNQDGENATDLECCYQILDYLTMALETK